jgi:hypothetical protein
VTVQATSREPAERAAVRMFDLTPEQSSRLMVQESTLRLVQPQAFLMDDVPIVPDYG